MYIKTEDLNKILFFSIGVFSFLIIIVVFILPYKAGYMHALRDYKNCHNKYLNVRGCYEYLSDGKIQ